MENRNYNDSESQNDNMEDDLEGTFNDRDTWLSPNTHHAKWNMP